MEQLFRGAASKTASQSPPTGLENFVLPGDLDAILEIEKEIDGISGMSGLTAPNYIQKFLKGKELTSRYLADVSYKHERAVDMSRKMRSLAYLEKSTEYLAKLGRKPTDEGCKMYAELDEGYRNARDVEIYFQSLVEYIRNKYYLFNDAHNVSVEMYKKLGEPLGSMKSIPSSRS